MIATVVTDEMDAADVRTITRIERTKIGDGNQARNRDVTNFVDISFSTSLLSFSCSLCVAPQQNDDFDRRGGAGGSRYGDRGGRDEQDGRFSRDRGGYGGSRQGGWQQRGGYNDDRYEYKKFTAKFDDKSLAITSY